MTTKITHRSSIELEEACELLGIIANFKVVNSAERTLLTFYNAEHQAKRLKELIEREFWNIYPTIDWKKFESLKWKVLYNAFKKYFETKFGILLEQRKIVVVVDEVKNSIDKLV